MAKGCKCDPHEICEECPEWIFTLADLIMCMMGLFVLLWVLKPSGGAGAAEAKAAQEKLNNQIAAIREELGYVPPPDSADPIDQILRAKRSNSIGTPKGPGEGGETDRPKDGAQGTDPAVQAIRPGNAVAIGGRILFKRGDATLTTETKRALNELGLTFRGHRQVVIIKGHASLDDLGESSSAQARMELSLKRAQVVRDYLESLGVSADTLRIVGCSVFEPVRERAYTAEAQAENRRVEVQNTDVLVPELQDPAQSKSRKAISPE